MAPLGSGRNKGPGKMVLRHRQEERVPRYYFHIRNHDGFDEDLEGTELPSFEAAREEAIAAAREILAERVLQGDLIDGDVFEITREDGVIIDRIPFRSTMNFST